MAVSIPTLRGGARLVFDSVQGIVGAVEKMHTSIAATPVPGMRENPRPQGLVAASVYTAIRGVNGLLRDSVDRGFELVPDYAQAGQPAAAEIKAIAALNGAFGDHLEATDNALALPMTVRFNGAAIASDAAIHPPAAAQASQHLVLFVHGLGLSELSWVPEGGIGDRLAETAGFTPLYLRYNTGRHISSNGQQLARLLDELCAHWPLPVESISLVGHSMGGLVVRSACWYAGQADAAWLSRLKSVVCLGSPHHGAPLEKAGHALDLAVARIPYAEALAFGRQRSAGIKDLRHGNLLDEDWRGRDPDGPTQDERVPVPLLPGIDYYFVAATVGYTHTDILGELLGDLLVRLESAVGGHRNDLKRLHIKPEHCRVFCRKNHFDLLTDPEVQEQLAAWLGGH